MESDDRRRAFVNGTSWAVSWLGMRAKQTEDRELAAVFKLLAGEMQAAAWRMAPDIYPSHSPSRETA